MLTADSRLTRWMATLLLLVLAVAFWLLREPDEPVMPPKATATPTLAVIVLPTATPTPTVMPDIFTVPPTTIADTLPLATPLPSATSTSTATSTPVPTATPVVPMRQRG